MPKGEDAWKAIIMVGFIAIVFIYLFGQFTRNTATGIEFVAPADAGITALVLLKILIIGAAIFGAVVIFNKVGGGGMSKRDVATLIVLGIVIYFLWDQILVRIFGAADLDSITFSIAKKTGIIP